MQLLLVAYPESGWCASWLLRTRGHLSKTVLYSHTHLLLCSFRVRQLSNCFLWENLYLSMWQTNFLQSRLCQKHHLKKRGWGKESVAGTTAFNIQLRGVDNKLHCLWILYFLYSCFFFFLSLQALMLYMARKMTVPSTRKHMCYNSKHVILQPSERKTEDS